MKASTVRRGLALLVVLAFLAATSAAVVSAARVALDARQSHEVAIAACEAIELHHAAEDVIAFWLNRQARRLTLPADCAAPAIVIVQEDLGDAVGQPRCELVITAFDQCGMISHLALEGRSPWRRLIPRDVLYQFDQSAKQPTDSPPGLDTYDGLRYPTAAAHRLGAHVATHNVRRANRSWTLNVATAPLPLIELALRIAGQGSVDAIRASRAAGRVPPVPFLIEEPNPLRPNLTNASHLWSFRIDATVRGVRRSAWATYERRGDRWVLLQRLLIDE